MSVGKNIRYHRKRRGITQKELGRRVGFPVASADVRIAQYENDSRCPKEPLLRAMAAALGVSPAALSAPNFAGRISYPDTDGDSEYGDHTASLPAAFLAEYAKETGIRKSLTGRI